MPIWQKVMVTGVSKRDLYLCHRCTKLAPTQNLSLAEQHLYHECVEECVQISSRMCCAHMYSNIWNVLERITVSRM